MPGEVGDAVATVRVTAADVLRVRGDLGTLDSAGDHPLDFNRDGRISAGDYAVARAANGTSLVALSAAQGAAGAALVNDLFGRVPVTPRRPSYRPVRVWDETPAGVLA